MSLKLVNPSSSIDHAQSKFLLLIALGTAFISSIIVIHADIFTLYWIPLISSLFYIYFQKQFRLPSLKHIHVPILLFGILIIIFRLFFVGLDNIPNSFHPDFLYYGAASDAILLEKTEFFNLTNFSLERIYFYHFTELWLGGIFSIYWKTTALKALILLAYPAGLVFDYFLIYYFYNIHFKQITIQRFHQKTIFYLFIIIIFAFISQNFPHIPFLNNYLAIFRSGYLKLIFNIPIALCFAHFAISKFKGQHSIFLLISTCFLYPPSSVFVFSYSIAHFILTNFKTTKFNVKNLLYANLTIWILIIFSWYLKIDFIQEITRSYRSDLIRLGSLSTLLFPLLFNIRTAINFFVFHQKLLLYSILFNLILYTARNYNPAIFNIDTFQLIDNTMNLLSHILVFCALISISISKIFYKIAIVLTPICLFFLAPKNVSTNYEFHKFVEKSPENKTTKHFILTGIVEENNKTYSFNPYIQMDLHSLFWNIPRLRIVDCRLINNPSNSHEINFNQRNKRNFDIINNKDSVAFYKLNIINPQTHSVPHL